MRIFSITGCQGTEALAFARRKRSSGPFASGLTPQDRRDDLQLAAAVRAVLEVEVESEASAQTNLYSSYVVAKTRLSSFAQLSRTGLWCAQIASHSAGGAAWAGGSRSCGTTSARSLALGARTPWFAKRGPLTSRSEVTRTPNGTDAAAAVAPMPPAAA